jgi:hypothetical protein
MPANHAPATPAPDCTAQARARAVIRTIHGSILTYRGGLWAELARARWLLLRTSAVAGLVAYLILALALLFGISEIHFGTAWAYFLTGAVAGLFLRLRSAGTETEVSDDYGLEAARLYTTPLLSGMAAVIGVIIMASIAGSTLGDILDPAPEAAAVAAVASPSPTVSPSPNPSPSAGPSVSPSPSIAPSVGVAPEASGSPVASEPAPQGQITTERLENAFDLRHYPVGLVIALIFGLTPGLVLDRLGASLGNTKSALVTSRATRPT